MHSSAFGSGMTPRSLHQRFACCTCAAGLCAGAPLDVEAIVGPAKDKEAKLSEAAFAAVTDLYMKIEDAIKDPSKGSASGFAQPWLS